MKKKFLIVFFLSINTFVSAQYSIDLKPLKNSVYIEIYGNSGHSLSINFDRLINNKNTIGIRAGIGFYNSPISSRLYSYLRYYSVPIEFYGLLLDGNHHIELGSGLSYLGSPGSKMNFVVIFSRIGYRYTGKKGLLLRAGFTPVIDFSTNFFSNRFPLNPFGGISIGYRF